MERMCLVTYPGLPHDALTSHDVFAFFSQQGITEWSIGKERRANDECFHVYVKFQDKRPPSLDISYGGDQVARASVLFPSDASSAYGDRLTMIRFTMKGDQTTEIRCIQSDFLLEESDLVDELDLEEVISQWSKLDAEERAHYLHKYNFLDYSAFEKQPKMRRPYLKMCPLTWDHMAECLRDFLGTHISNTWDSVRGCYENTTRTGGTTLKAGWIASKTFAKGQSLEVQRCLDMKIAALAVTAAEMDARLRDKYVMRDWLEKMQNEKDAELWISNVTSPRVSMRKTGSGRPKSSLLRRETRTETGALAQIPSKRLALPLPVPDKIKKCKSASSNDGFMEAMD